ncbi:HlyD family type I secretion periplasmic adaptor subunit [Aliarcobacter cibarius]|jgi:membrane fusion protein, adhesin transport system|uniref:HlyD family type I secretion periplasmic adaptor subunit n=1 Tax=Aliarcobacter cibarius TaxID=255507 RepID=UPI0010FE2354|nr:HlyD family type I secretion periplasmic adaptor subunit [Aliarcobacter cibarius]QEZ89931.1 type I secretion system membrane fusion protein, HlyD family [Aliarcobacter cibarius]TLT05395.1 HlyD family type I secretion periplasmic adaptor subunit [Aliarcobacter cibarius]
MENLNKDNENSNINVIENNEHLIVVKNPKLLEKENKNWKFFYKIKNSIKAIYGLGDDKYNEKEDLDFIYTNYSHANEEASLVSKVIFTIVVGIFTIFLIWATFAEIDELARGAGKVIPTDKVQTVQSLDGGIISEIFIKEGDIVKFDAPLMKIDTTRFQATLEESRQEYLSLLALKARLEKEATINIDEPLQELVFDEKILQDPSRYDLNEKMLYENRYKELKSSISVLATQESQKIQELKEIESTIKKLKDNLGFIEEQKKTIKQLVERKIKSNIDLLDMEKEYNQTKGDLQTANLSITRSNFAIQEARNKIQERLNTFRSEASNELQKTVSQINRFEAKLVGDKDKVDKTTITSPVDGIVKQLNFNTIGGVVQPGVDLIEIVPLSDALVVEAKIDPKDIAFINPSQKAIIKITAYDFSIYGGLEGKIIEISADSIVDKESKEGKSYYRVLVKTDKNYLERKGKKLPIIPGMVATVDIVTGKKTIMDFILKPILKVKQDSLHER